VSRLYLTTDKAELARRRTLIPKGQVVEAWADHHDGGALWIGEETKTLLDETFIAVVSEFGRVPGPLNGIAGRHHYNLAYHALFAGAGVQGGRILGKTDATGEQVLDSGWRYKKMQTKTENIYATMYSSLGIDWKKEITNTPSRRAYRYIDVLGATEFVMDDEIVELFV